MSKKANLYIGRAGQMAVMAEFLIRGYNVAIPEVDGGRGLAYRFESPPQRGKFACGGDILG